MFEEQIIAFVVCLVLMAAVNHSVIDKYGYCWYTKKKHFLLIENYFSVVRKLEKKTTFL